MDKTLKLIFLVFALIGTVFAAVGICMGVHYASQTAGMVPAQGHIVAFSRDGYPSVEYTVGGQTFEFAAHSKSSAMRLGDGYRLMIDPDDPVRHMDDTLVFLSWVFGGIGGVFLLVGVCCLAVTLRRKKRLEELRLYGQRTSATVTDVRQNLNVRVNNRHPWYVVAECRNPVTGQAVTVKSPSFFHLQYQPGSTVDVLFDPMDPDKYVVDLPEDRL